MQNGQICYSIDSINWIMGQKLQAPSNNWSGLVYGNEKFVAFQNSDISPRMAYSIDGLSWTVSDFYIRVSSVIFADNKFVAITTSGIVYSSVNGIDWVQISQLPSFPGGGANYPSGTWKGICYGAGVYIAYTQRGSDAQAHSYYCRSTDGINWSGLVDEGSDANVSIIRNLYFVNGRFISGVTAYSDINGWTKAKILSSVDGIDWSEFVIEGQATDPLITQTFCLAYGNGIYIMGGTNSSYSNYGAAISTDGIDWSSAPRIGAGYRLNMVVFNGNGFVGSNSARILIHTENGMDWTTTSFPWSSSSFDAIVGLVIGGGTIS